MDDRIDGVVRVGVLGRVRAGIDGRELDLGGPRQQALLARLAVDRGATVSTDALIDAVWDGRPPSGASRTFRTYVARLRKVIGDGAAVDAAEVVITDSAGYRLSERLTELDSTRFQAAVAEAREHLARGEAGEAAELVGAALDTWHGPALGPFADREWAQPEAVRLEELRVTARELEVRALLDAGRVEAAMGRAEALAAEHPLRESIARLLVLARYRADRHPDALAEVRAFRDRLADETGLDPSPQVDELERMVLDRDPRLDRPVGGRKLRGYVLHEVMGQTPVGTVHRAEQPSIGREVAITVLPPERADDPDFVRAFEARAQQVASVEHPHVVPVYDYWREPGAAYVVTRLPAGGTLAQRLQRDDLDREQVARVVRQVGGALAAAHERGVVHGAVDPSTVQIDARGDAFLWAFPLEVTDPHPRADVLALARLVLIAAGGTHELVGGQRRGHGVGTGVLPALAVELLEGVAAGAEERVSTVSQLVAELDRMLRPDPGGTGPAPASRPAGPNPYRGLAPFRETDAAVFFGRTALATTIRGRLARHELVALVGPSGSGKSSVVRAGVLPALRAQGHFVSTMVPGTRPLQELSIALTRVAAVELPDVADELAAAPEALAGLVRRSLPSDEGDLVLVLDQFEELFTVADPAERDVLLRALAHVLDDPLARCRVIATIRADFLGRVLEHPLAGALVRERTVMVSAMTSEELYEAVVGPAEVAGVAVEPALATAVVADASRAPGSLPMLQFALTEVYEAAEDGVMALTDYQRLGGIEGVLGQRAEEVVQQLDAEDREAARRLFNRLVVPTDDGPPARRRATRTELGVVPARVVDAFGRARLLRFDQDERTREPTVEVAHEALFRAWPRLVAWLEAGLDDLRVLGHLTTSAEDWDRGGREDAELYRGTRLDAALAFGEEHAEELTPVEREFLEAARRRRHAEFRREQRSARRLRQLVVGLAAGLVLALVAGGLAWNARQREAATRAGAEGDAIAFAASAVVEDDVELAALLAAEAYTNDPDPESTRALLDVLSSEPRIRGIELVPPGTGCSDQPTGADLAALTVAGPDGVAIEVRRFDGTPVATVPVDPTTVCATVDPAARWLLTGQEDLVARSVDARSGDVLAERDDIAIRGSMLWFIGYHPTDSRAVLVTLDGAVQVVELPGLEPVAEVAVPPDTPIGGAQYGERGDVVGVITRDGRMGVGRPGGEAWLSDPVPGLVSVVVAEQADLLIGLTSGGLVTTPVSAPGELSSVALGGIDQAVSAAVSPDGDTLALTTTDGIEVLALPELHPVGDTIAIDTTFARLGWAGDRLLQHGFGGLVTIEPDRVLGAGEELAAVPAPDVAVWPAPDGSGALLRGPSGTVWRSLTDGGEVPVGEVTEADPTGQLHASAPLPDSEWVHVDLGRAVFERWRGDEQVLATALPDDLPPHLRPFWENLQVDHGRAVLVVEELAAPLPSQETVATWVFAFDLATGELVTSRRIDILDNRFAHGIALPDGHVLATTYSPLVELLGPDGEVQASASIDTSGEFLAVAPSGGLVALGGFDGEVILVDPSLEVVGQLTGIASQARTMRFAGDERLVTQHADGTTYLWGVTEQRLLGRLLRTPTDRPHDLETTPDGSAVVHAVPGAVARIPLDPDVWLQAACDLVSRPLAQEELDAVVSGRAVSDACGLGGASASPSR